MKTPVKKWRHAELKKLPSKASRIISKKWNRKKWLPTWAIECSVAYGILIGFNTLFFSTIPAFKGVAPHPYLFLIVLMACRYGGNAGLFSGILGCAIHYIWASTGFQFRIFEEFDSVSRNCVIFVLTGTILGAIQNRIISRMKGLMQTVANQQTDINDHINRNKVLDAINTELEEKVYTEVQSFSSLREVSESLTHLNVTDICESIPGIVCEQLQADHASVYIYHEGTLKLAAKHSQVQRMRLIRDEITPDDSLMGICLKEKKPQCIRDYVSCGERPRHALESVMCAPLLDAKNELLGIINVEAMPFIKITESSINMLSLIAGLGGKNLAIAQEFDTLRKRTIIDDAYSIYEAGYMTRRLAEEFSRSEKSEHPFSVILVKLPAMHGPTYRQRRHEEIQILVNYFRLLCGTIGLIGHHTADIPLAILLLDQKAFIAERIISRADNELRQLLPSMNDRVLGLGVAHYRNTYTTPDELLVRAEAMFENTQ